MLGATWAAGATPVAAERAHDTTSRAVAGGAVLHESLESYVYEMAILCSLRARMLSDGLATWNCALSTENWNVVVSANTLRNVSDVVPPAFTVNGPYETYTDEPTSCKIPCSGSTLIITVLRYTVTQKN